jgi:serine/threonine-protein kinase
VITLTLLHPVQLTPVQHWTFEQESIVKIGRATDNHVVLYSAVVSRYHLEVRLNDSTWEIVNLGANGTYSDSRRVTQIPVRDGMILRLARSGPNLQVHFGMPTTASVQQNAESLTKAVLDPPTQNDRGTGETRTMVEPDPVAVPVGLPCRQVIGQYQILRRLGQGRTGITYLGSRDGQAVVLKTINPERISHPQAIAQFEQESQRLMQLSHPGLAQGRDCFVSEKPYYVMEWIEGQTLFQYVVKRGKVDPSKAVAWGLELCRVLGYLHQQQPGILHYDIRPENIIRRSTLETSCELALVDFGMVRNLAGHADQPFSGYTAPEQKDGVMLPVSDLYSVGTTLAFLISGQEPSLFYRQREQGYRFYAEYVPGLTPELVGVIRKLTHPSPSDRYQSAEEVAAALQKLA